jgi:hypothetical protein
MAHPQHTRLSWRARGAASFGALALGLAVMVPLALNSSAEPAGGAVTTPSELRDEGSLVLTTDQTRSVVRRDAANNVVSTQKVAGSVTCALSTTAANSKLLGFATTNGVPGLAFGTIGDKTGGTGADCGLVEVGGSLSLTLGSDITNLEMRSFALEIDTSTNLRVVLTASLDGVTTSTYELRTGTRIMPGVGSTTPGSQIYNCIPQATSGPNARDADDCRFIGNVLADKLVLRTAVGTMGLRGTSTWPSEIGLTDTDGFLDCESNNGDSDATEGGNGTPEVALVRKDNLDSNQPCKPIPFDLRSSVESGSPQLEFLKELGSQTSAAFTLDVSWPFEAAQNPPPPTQFEFVAGEPITLESCVGTPVYNSETGAFDGIGELLDDDPTNDSEVPDQAESLPGKQYSCYFHSESNVVGNGTIALEQGIYLIGDYKTYR